MTMKKDGIQTRGGIQFRISLKHCMLSSFKFLPDWNLITEISPI